MLRFLVSLLHTGKEGKGKTYWPSNSKLKDDHARQKAKHNTDTRREILDNIIRIPNHNARHQPAGRLQANCAPHDPVVPLKEAMLTDALAVLPEDTPQEGGDEGVKGELDVADPDGALVRGLLEDLLKVDAREARDGGGDEDGRDADGVVHLGLGREEVLGDAFVGGGAFGEVL